MLDMRVTSVNALCDEAQRSVGNPHSVAPYAEALRSLAARNWQRLHVPGHQANPENVPGLVDIVGEEALRLDFPMLFSGIDQHTWRSVGPGQKTPLEQAQYLAADAWGASRTWFVTNGASGCNHIATNVIRGLGEEFIAQRSVHSSVIDGMIHVGLDPVFVQGSVDTGLGAANGVTAAQIEQALRENPQASAVFIVTPSYFGAVADVSSIARVAHDHGVPLIVDEAWGSHFGFHEGLPTNAVRLGADLVISSTHKAAGSLTQTAMLQLGHGPLAKQMESLVDRVVRSYQSTSCSSLLLASIDEARRNLMTSGHERITLALESAEAVRRGIREQGRFGDATPAIRGLADAVDHDPFKIVIDMRNSGITGTEAHYLLTRDHGVVIELATASAIILLVGATSPIDSERVLRALHALPRTNCTDASTMRPIPAQGERVLKPSDAFFAPIEIVSAAEAVGRVSADSLAAYPPGVPNVIPGERLTQEVVDFLRSAGAAPSGYVRGANDPKLDTFRVLR